MDSNLFFPGADLSHRAPVDGGSILGGEPKCLWHSTQGSNLPSYSDNFFPNMTICKGVAFQHIPANRAARALKNLSGGVQTNRWNVFQIEVCGFANDLAFVSVMQEVADWLQDVRRTPKTCTVEFIQFDASFGTNNGVRLSKDEWRVYSGHLGHMHAPENDHGDPGSPFPIARILGGDAGSPSVGGGDDMTTDELLKALESDRGKKILKGVVTEAVREQLATVIRGDPNTQDGGTHPHNLRNITIAVKEIKDKLPG